MENMLNTFLNIEQILNTKYTNNRIEWDTLFSIITKLISYKSSCAKTRQGAIIVKENRIISMGYNGPPSGDINCMFDGGEEKCGKDTSGSCMRAIHAEQNCLAFSNLQGLSVEGATMYVTMTPCISCARLIVAHRIKEYKYLEEYRITEGLDFLNRYGVKTQRYER